jgi:hypothetical protein
MGGNEDVIPDEYADQIVSACRTAVGDHLRSVVYFTAADEAALYFRSDLEAQGERSRRVKHLFVENERMGFSSQETYNRLAEVAGDELDIGDYEFTVRVFSEGFVSRVIVGRHGVIMTTDSMQIDAFEELSVTLRKLLAEFE